MEIKLNKNGWYCRLQKYVFGTPPTFYNFCPMFWLTNFCILVTFIIPIVPLIKALRFLLHWSEKGFDKVATWLEKSICIPAFEAKSSRMSLEEVLNAWFFNTNDTIREWTPETLKEMSFWQNHILNISDYDTPNKKREAYIKKFDAWKKTTPNWEKVLNHYKEHRKSTYEEYLKNKDKIDAEREEARLKVIKDEAQAKIRKANMYNSIISANEFLEEVNNLYPIY